MIKFKSLFAQAASAAFFFACTPAMAQWQVPDNAVPIGRGSGIGFKNVPMPSGSLLIGQSGIPQAIVPTGDVTINTSGVTAIGTAKVTTAMMALNSVTNARLAQMANNTFKCRNTAGTGDPEDCTAAQVRTILALVIGTNVQAWDADLDCLAALSGTGILRRTGAGTCSNGTAVANSELATAGAYTFKGNATGSTATPTDFTIGGLTQKASPAGTDEVVIADNAASGQFKRALVSALGGGGSGVTTLNGQTGGLNATYAPQGRLTPVSGSPVWSTDQAAKTVLYYDATGTVGKQVPVYNGSNVIMLPICAAGTAGTCNVTLTLGSNWAASTAFDVYGYNNGGTLGLCTVAWSNSGAGTSTRATTLQAFDAFQTNSAIATCRTTNAATTSCAANQCTYLGSFLTNGSTGTYDFKFGTAASGGGAACLCIYNPYNQVQQSAMVIDSGASYNYTLAAYQQARASTGNQVTILVGSAGSAIRAGAYAQSANSTGGIINASGVGIDVTNANSAQIQLAAQSSAGNTAPSTAVYSGSPSAGVHVVARLEYSQAAGTTTWYAGSIAGIQAGLELTWLN